MKWWTLENHSRNLNTIHGSLVLPMLCFYRRNEDYLYFPYNWEYFHSIYHHFHKLLQLIPEVCIHVYSQILQYYLVDKCHNFHLICKHSVVQWVDYKLLEQVNKVTFSSTRFSESSMNVLFWTHCEKVNLVICEIVHHLKDHIWSPSFMLQQKVFEIDFQFATCFVMVTCACCDWTPSPICLTYTEIIVYFVSSFALRINPCTFWINTIWIQQNFYQIAIFWREWIRTGCYNPIIINDYSNESYLQF